MKKKVVIVALSGGVDSAVSAALLLRKGYEVRGVFMRQYDYADVGQEKKILLACAQEEDRKAACDVATTLGIPFQVWDFRKIYHQKVVEYLFREYRRGRTPNPDSMCNTYLKFGAFLDRTRKEGSDFIATGHYARIKQLPITNYQLPITYKLLKARDTQKDQTYFLYTLSQKKLKHCLFPLSGYTKSQVRLMAQEFGLPNWNRKDSQGICFVGDVSMQNFLQSRIPLHQGPVVTEKGMRIGTHRGAAYYTIGQRRGLGLPGGDAPWYVSAIDIKKNTLIVCQGEKKSQLYSKELRIKKIHWISGSQPQFPFSCSARIRYRQPLQKCTIHESGITIHDSRFTNKKLGKKFIIHNSKFIIRFSKSQRAVTPGQAIVFYKGKECLGGGIIDTSC